jgi:cytochrome b pre-mRNA-processing protein 3
MLFHLFRPVSRAPIIASLYGTIVAQARAPIFYRSYGVPDTVNGRFEMMALHTVLLLRRLEQEADPLRRLGQEVFDRFCRDLDDSLREMGVGDLAVPRRMRRLGEAFYGRQQAYAAALAETDDAPLAAALERNVFAGALAAGNACRMAAYVRAAASVLAAQRGFDRGELAFPDPGRWLDAGAGEDARP